MTINEINEVCSLPYECSSEAVNGYRIWFRGYVPSSENNYLVGIACAWPLPGSPKAEHRFFDAVAGMDTVHEYNPGEYVDIDGSKMPTFTNTLEYFKEIRDEAMERIRLYIAALPAKEAA